MGALASIDHRVRVSESSIACLDDSRAEVCCSLIELQETRETLRAKLLALRENATVPVPAWALRLIWREATKRYDRGNRVPRNAEALDAALDALEAVDR